MRDGVEIGLAGGRRTGRLAAPRAVAKRPPAGRKVCRNDEVGRGSKEGNTFQSR